MILFLPPFQLAPVPLLTTASLQFPFSQERTFSVPDCSRVTARLRAAARTPMCSASSSSVRWESTGARTDGLSAHLVPNCSRATGCYARLPRLFCARFASPGSQRPGLCGCVAAMLRAVDTDFPMWRHPSYRQAGCGGRAGIGP